MKTRKPNQVTTRSNDSQVWRNLANPFRPGDHHNVRTKRPEFPVKLAHLASICGLVGSFDVAESR